MEKIDVALLGGRGSIGQVYRQKLLSHPFFHLNFEPKEHLTAESFPKILEEVAKDCRVVFSALPSFVAKEYEHQFAARGLFVFSISSHHRLSSDVPLLIPEINPDHLNLLSLQRKRRGWEKGGIIAKPNCTLQSYLLPLFPLDRTFGLEKVIVTTLQSMSGAGKGFALKNNVIPFIEGEEEKSEKEPLKILGKATLNGIELKEGVRISVHCNRVPVEVGHSASVSVSFKKKPTKGEILDIWNAFSGEPQEMNLPSAPKHPVIYLNEVDRPQVIKDCTLENGMAVSVGRLRECPVLDFRFTALSHNLIRGGAGGALLGAELVFKKGMLW